MTKKDIKGAKGGSQDQHKPIEYPNTLTSNARIQILDLVSEGEIVGLVDGLKSVYLDETPVQNADGTNNFQNIQLDYRVGTPNQAPIVGFNGVENELGVGVELTSTTPYTHSFTNLNMTSLRVRLSTPALSQQDTSNGDVRGYKVDYKIEISVDSGPYQLAVTSGFNGKTTSKYERQHVIDLPPATTSWTVKVTRLTANTATGTIQDKTYIESLTEIVDGKYRYPYSALMGIRLDAKQFQNVPSRAYDIKGRIIQVPTNYDPATRHYNGVWDGNFQLAWTDNPAWIWYDIVTNDRYGLGDRLGTQHTNKWALYTIAQYCDGYVPTGLPKRANLATTGSLGVNVSGLTRNVTRSSGSWVTDGWQVGDSIQLSGFAANNNVYAIVTAVTAANLTISAGSAVMSTQGLATTRSVTLVGQVEPRFTCNVFLQSQSEAYKVIKDMATVFRGMVYWMNGEVVGITDSPTTPTFTYAPANVINGRFTYHGTGKKARHTVALVTWNDPASFGRSKVEYVDDQNGIAKYGVQQTDIMAIGCTSQSQAHRMGRYALLTAQYATQTVDFEVGLDALLCTPGDIIRIADPLRAGTRLGGRVVESWTNELLYSDNLSGPAWTTTSATRTTVGTIFVDTRNFTAPQLVASNGQTWHRIDQSIGARAAGEKLAMTWYVKAGTSGRVRCNIRNGTLATESNITGVLGGTLTAGSTAGAVANITSTAFSGGVYKITATFTCASAGTYSIGIGPDSATVGEDITALGAQVVNGDTVYPLIRTSNAKAAGIHLDAPIVASTGDTFNATLETGVIQSLPIAVVSGDGLYLSFDNQVFTNNPAPGSMWSVDRADLETQQYRVLAISETDIGKYAISAVEHNDSIFDAVDFNTAVDVPPTVGELLNAPAPPASVSVTSHNHFGTVTTGQVLTISWPKSTRAVRYYVEYQRDDDDWIAMQPTNRNSVDIRNVFPGTYRARVAAESAANGRSDSTLSADYVLTDQTEPPGYVASINASIATAMTTAENAAAIADGAIISFWQASPPTIGTSSGQAKEGDFWFDTDDGNHLYRVVGGVWVTAQDDAIGTALGAAATAQSTADGKVKTWFGPTAPTSPDVTTVKGIGDLWYDTVAKKLKRWTGLGWTQDIADVTYEQLAGTGVNLCPDDYSTFEGTLPTLNAIGCTYSAVTGKITKALRLAVGTGDPVWPYVKAQLSFEGSSGFTGAKGDVWTSGSPGLHARLDTAQFKFGTQSLYATGASGLCWLRATDAAFAIGTGDFTVEGWFRREASSALAILWDWRPDAVNGLYPCLYHDASGNLHYFVNNADRITGTGGNLPLNTWVHVRLSRVSGNTRLFVGGVQTGSTYADTNNYIGTRITLGHSGYTAGNGYTGHIDEFRFSLYGLSSANFSPPTTAFATGGGGTNVLAYANPLNTNVRAQFAVNPAKRYLFSAYVRTDTAGQVATDLNMVMYGSAGTMVSVPCSTVGGTLAVNTWYRVSAIVPGTTFGATEDWAVPYMTFNSASGALWDMDGLMVEEMIGGLQNPATFVRGPSASMAITAATAATAAQGTANAAAVDAASSLNQLSDIASDSKLTANEKNKAKIEYDEVRNEYDGIVGTGTRAGIGKILTDYTSAMTALVTYLQGLGLVNGSSVWTNITGTTDITRTTWDQKWKDLYLSRQTLLNYIADAQSLGDDLVIQGSFESGAYSAGYYSSGTGLAVGAHIIDGWDVTESTQPAFWNVIVNTNTTRLRSGTKSISFGLQAGTLAAGATAFVVVSNPKKIPVKPGDRFRVRGMVKEDFSGALTTGLRRVIFCGLRYYNSAGTPISQAGLNYDSIGPSRTPGPGTDNTAQQENIITIPSGTAFVAPAVFAYVQNTTGASLTTVASNVVASMDDVEIMRWGGGHELTEQGSGKQIGDLRNVPPTGFANVGSAWITGAVTYTAAAGTPATATISFSAATLRINGVDIAYSASSVGVTGTNGGSTTYMLYYDDPTWAGGSRTLAATTSFNTLINALGRVYVGNVTVAFPSSGSSGGGGDKLCVTSDMQLPDGRVAGDVQVGDYMHLCDPATREEIGGLVSCAKTGYVECVELRAANGVVLRCSTTAPIPTDIGYLDAPETLGRMVLTKVNDRIEESVIETVIHIGVQEVRHITVGDRCFWAGENGFMLHHNLKMDPGP